MDTIKKLVTVTALTLGLSLPAVAQDVFVVKYSHQDPMSDISKGHVPATFFKNYVEEASEGRLRVQIFPSGQLGGDQDSIQQVQAGMLEIAQVSMGGVANFAPELQVLDLPYMLPNDEVAEYLVEGPLVKEVHDTFIGKMNNSNLVAMSNLARWRSFFTTDKPVKNADDLKGLKIRTIQSELQQEFTRSIGAVPVSMPFGEVYTGLATGMADGLKNSVNDMIEFAWLLFRQRPLAEVFA